MRRIQVYLVPDPHEEYTDEEMEKFLMRVYEFDGEIHGEDITRISDAYPDRGIVLRVDTKDVKKQGDK